MDTAARRSAASLSVISPQGHPSRLHPPPSLSPEERTVFVDLVAACDSKHFRVSDIPLLARYCEAAVLGEQAALELRQQGAVLNGKPSPWIVIQEKAVRAMVSLSMRLRLSPQARAVRTSLPPPRPLSAYEKMAIEDDD
jgi:phage terminase small subunit